MDFRPSPAQLILTKTARAFLRQHCPPELAQRLALDEHGFDDALWRRMAELGWPGLLIPFDLGGSDGSLLDVVLLVEEMGRAGLPGPFVTSAVVATSLVLAARNTAHSSATAWSSNEPLSSTSARLAKESGSFELHAVALECAVPG